LFTGFIFYAGSVTAINCLYAALGYPSLPGWVPNGGDPCTESWQGVLCNNTDISSMYGNPSLIASRDMILSTMSTFNPHKIVQFFRVLIDANLGGELGDCLSSFSSIKEMYVATLSLSLSLTHTHRV